MIVERPRILFFGTPEFAVPCFDAACEIGDVVTLVCQPDRPQGRGLALLPPATKVRALARGIPILQPSKVRTAEFAESLRALRADIAVVVAYGRILTREVLDAPRLGCVNVHASLLPRWRGAAPIQWALMAGDSETGVCLMQMDEGLDTGPVLTRRTLAIDDTDTSPDLFGKLSILGGSALRDELPRILRGELQAIAQLGESTHARMLKKEDARLDFSRTAVELERQVRAMTPWPGSECMLGDERIKVFAARVVRDTAHDKPLGTWLAADNGLHVACAHGSVIAFAAMQHGGRKRVAADEFLRGVKTVLGETAFS